MSADVIEPVAISSVHVDGVAAVHVDQVGVARVNLYAEQLGVDGEIERTLVARLTMSAAMMREVADRLLTASMVASHRGERALAEMRARMD